MEIFKDKARNNFISGVFNERIGHLDVASSDYFKALAATNDFVLAKLNLSAKNHDERFALLKEHLPLFYKITSSLFLTYRRAYTKEITFDEVFSLKNKIKEAFQNAGISVPTEEEVDEYLKKALKR
jgi:hypothetical protein